MQGPCYAAGSPARALAHVRHHPYDPAVPLHSAAGLEERAVKPQPGIRVIEPPVL